jgi:hypothetical protein
VSAPRGVSDIPQGAASGRERRDAGGSPLRLLHPEEARHSQQKEGDRGQPEDGLVVATRSEDDVSDTDAEQ